MGFQGILCCCYPTPFWVILFLHFILLLVLFLGYEGCKGIM